MPGTDVDVLERELIARLGQPVPVGSPSEVGAVWSRRGVEIALAREHVQERSLRRVWNERQGSRGRPLLLIAPAADSGVFVVGPILNEPQVVEPLALVAAIEQASELAPNEASRRLEREIATLAAQDVPGVTVRGLLTGHYVRTRLDQRADLRSPLVEAAEPARGKRDWRDTLTALGFELLQRDERGYEARHEGRVLAIVHPKSTPDEFARMDEQGRLPEGVLLADCHADHAPWGIMASQGRLRLFDSNAARGAASERWIDLDLLQLPDEYFHLVGLLAPSALSDGGSWPRLMDDARDFGADLRERLDGQIRLFALPEIAQGLGDWLKEHEDADLSDPETRAEIQSATMTLLFRLLFILYAESAGHLPYRHPGYRNNALKTLCSEALERRGKHDPGSHMLWNRLRTLTRGIREGDRGMDLPQYNGTLFAEEGLEGARLLERAEIADTRLAPALEALGFDPDDEQAGLDYTDLDIAHLGGIYEGLLALRLSLADQTYQWDSKKDRFIPAEEPGTDGVEEGFLFFQSEAGGRKSGGVYYTRQEFVRHLINHSVVPALEEHLQQVRELARTDGRAAEGLLFRFRVLDPAMGSAHFLVDALDVIADRVQTFLAETPLLPLRERLDALRAEARAESADDAQLLKRLLLKHCIYGVDRSGMAVELARVALWLSSFVPGLALSYLDQNLKQGDSLVGVGSLDTLRPMSDDGRGGGQKVWLWAAEGQALDEAIRRAGELALQIADSDDRTKEEVEHSRDLRRQLEASIGGVRDALDLWAAEPFGLKGARAALTNGDEIIEGDAPSDLAGLLASARAEARKRHFFHWPVEFPEVFHRASERSPGFDAVIGNPPWDEITVEELGFYALHAPGLRGLGSQAEQEERIKELLVHFPELADEFEQRKLEAKTQRDFFRVENGYVQQGGGDTDLYQLFCERYATLTRAGGRLGVVLPRSTLLVDGGRGFRRWLFSQCRPTRTDLLLNRGRWAFDMEVRYTIALLTAEVGPSVKGGAFTTTGPSRSLPDFLKAIGGEGVRLPLDDLAAWTPPPAGDAAGEPGWEVPLLPSPDHVRVLGRIRRYGVRFDHLTQPSRSESKMSIYETDAAASRRIRGQERFHGTFATTEFHETQQRRFWVPSREGGLPVWKGRSFDQYAPHGQEPAGRADWAEVLTFVQKKRLSSRSKFVGRFPREVLEDPSTHPIRRSRVAFRDVSRSTDSRTVRACLVPPRTPLTNSAPYLVFPSGDVLAEAYVLGVMNSLPFDWQARRYIETHLNFYVLDLLCFPADGEVDHEGIARRAARLSCTDERFAESAEEGGADCGPLFEPERDHLRAEIDARVAHAYGLTDDDLRFIFTDFTERAVTPAYRALVLEAFAGLK